jgi:LPXTG-site transpeptidase (sortase) family protein
MSHLLTPLEPVAWDSSQSAAPLNPSETFKRLSRVERSFKPLVWIYLWFSAIDSVITLGWLHRRLAIFSSLIHPNHQFCFVLSNFHLSRRVESSHGYKGYQTSLLLFLNFILILIFVQTVRAKEVVSTIPTRLLIPSIAMDSVVVPVGWKKVEVGSQTYAQWKVDDNLVGWHNLSAPLGQIGNSVLNGHSNLYAQVFRNLDQVEVGDSIVVFSGDQSYYYVVTEKILVQEKGVSLEKRIENAKLILPTADKRLTLITCARPGATHRLIIIAYPDTSYR